MAGLDNNQQYYLNKPKVMQAPNKNSNIIEKIHISDQQKNNTLKILHLNIHGLSHKIDELVIPLLPNPPLILCLSEHHLKLDEIMNTNLDMYTLVAQFCRQTFKQGGVCIYVLNNLQFNSINLDKFNREKDMEICALTLSLSACSAILICIYRSPIGNFNFFLKQLKSILNKNFKLSADIILCGDFLTLTIWMTLPRKNYILIQSLLPLV